MAWNKPVRAVLATAILAVSLTCQAQSNEEAELRALLPYVEGLTPPPQVPRQSCAARVVAYALLYRAEPNKYRNDFFGELVVNDYAQRSAGQYTLVEPDRIATTVDSASALPGNITEPHLSAAAGFCALKDKNLWVFTRKAGRISLARVLRGMALTSLLEGTDEDPLAIASAIDAHTAAQSPARP
ncbi:hypothetical protein [Lysobacter sp. HA35]